MKDSFMQQHFPVFTVTPQGILMDGMPLNKSASGNLSPETRHCLRRMEELLATVKEEDWEDRTPHAMNNVSVLARVRIMAALASPQPFPSSSVMRQELAKDAADDSDDEDDDDSEDGSSDGDDSGNEDVG
jgi:hypothetical protein